MSMQKPLEVTVISAKDLKDVNILSRMEVYAVIWLSNNPRIRHRTPTDRKGGKSPSWNNTTFQFFVPDGPVDGLVLHFLLRCERSLGDRDVGEVHVPVKEILSAPASGKSPQFVSYEVRRPSGKPKGVLNLSFKVGEPIAATTHVATPYEPPVGSFPAPGVASAYAAPAKDSVYPPMATTPAYVAPPPAASSKADVPITAYPAGPSSAYPTAGAAAPYPHPGYPPYPPPPHQPYGYGAPPPQGYGYPPPPAYGYGQPPVAQPQQPKKNKFGMGLGAGLLGGALGGLLIGDMISDGAAYDAGYDAGFDDAFF